MKRYVAATFAFALLGLAALGGVLGYKYYGLRDLHADPRLGQLLRYQEEKIAATAADAEVVFVGDSSLGNAIDADLFQELTGRSAVNLALTGSFHYAGAYVQLKELASRPNAIRTVVLMYAVDAPATTLSADGYFFMSATPVVPDLPFGANVSIAKTFVERMTDAGAAADYLQRLAKGEVGEPLPDYLLAEDYIVSGAQIALTDNGFRVPAKVGRLHRGFLPLIGELCRTNGWRCVYTHGPLLDYALTLTGGDTAPFFAEAAAKIAETSGLEVATPEPVLFTPEQRGDTFFHVHPDEEAHFTALYAGILTPYLQPRR